MRAHGGAVGSAHGCMSRSPLGSRSVGNSPGTSSGTPSNAVHGFQSSLRKPYDVGQPADADDVDAEGVEQVGGDLAEHLVTAR